VVDHGLGVNIIVVLKPHFCRKAIKEPSWVQ